MAGRKNVLRFIFYLTMVSLEGDQMLPAQAMATQLPSVMTIGGAVCDIFMEGAFPEPVSTRLLDSDEGFIMFPEGRKIELTSINYVVGGGGANVAIGLAKFGLPTAIFFKSGNDHIADFVRTELIINNIDVKHAITDDKTSTGTSFILPSPSQDKTVLTYRGANAKVVESELPCSFFSKFNGIYIAPISGNLAQLLPIIAQKAHEAGCIVMHNPSRHQLTLGISKLIEALQFIDIIMVNKAEAQLLYKNFFRDEPFSAERFFSQIDALGTKTIVLTDGSNGALCSTKNKILQQKPFPTKVTTTVGAGDAFGAAFFGAILIGKSFSEALLFGTLNSSSTLSCPTPHKGLLSLTELEKKANLTTCREFEHLITSNKVQSNETILYS